jgi:hypothetical protein
LPELSQQQQQQQQEQQHPEEQADLPTWLLCHNPVAGPAGSDPSSGGPGGEPGGAILCICHHLH